MYSVIFLWKSYKQKSRRISSNFHKAAGGEELYIDELFFILVLLNKTSWSANIQKLNFHVFVIVKFGNHIFRIS